MGDRGIGPGARVADLGCGPAAVLLELRERVGVHGVLRGVDADPDMVERARADAAAAGADNVGVSRGDADDSGLPAGEFDCVLVRLVLLHNGGREQAIVDHAASLVRPGGVVFLYDLDTTMVRVVPPTAPVSEMGERFHDYQRRVGNDPGVGTRLPELLESAGLTVEAFRGQCRTGRRNPGQRGPIWAARRAMLAQGVVTEEDLDRWDREFAVLEAAPVQPWMVVSVFTALGRR
ncbi:methyltransferase domain-containing protein [Actinomycetospora termitidis]|uniref:methyltransferase domain-containing protein n=1 Tax=Actinomycetospora termitidis TaxID=3053470 RepID=UPI0031F312D6